MTPARKTQTPLLAFRNIHHTFAGDEILRGVSASLEAGTFTCLLGPSGCGKTTLLRLVAGLEPLQSGHVSIAGARVADARSGLDTAPEHRPVGMVFQGFSLFPHLNVRQNILFGVAADDTARRAWAEQEMERFGLMARAENYPSTLSGGEQQRVALLRALAPRPALLLLDEPFSNLDAARRLDLREETLALVHDTKTSVLMVTHDAEEAMFMSDHILVMHNGRIVQQGAPHEVYTNPANAYVVFLCGHANRFDAQVRNQTVATPLGRFRAPDAMADGARARVYVRAEGIAPASGKGPVFRGRILTAHYMGTSSHLHLDTPDSPNGLVIHAQISGRVLPASGTTVDFQVDPAQVFVFPDTAADA